MQQKVQLIAGFSRGISELVMVALLFVVNGSQTVSGQSESAGSHSARPRISQPVDIEKATTLRGHVRRSLAAVPDLGPVEDATPVRLYLVLRRSPEQEADLKWLIARQQQPGVAEFHQWLTPEQFRERFGAAQDDIAKLSSWLAHEGFQVHSLLKNGSYLDFSGTAGQVRHAFRTQLHQLQVHGGVHIGLRSDPMIPAALEPAVAGIQGLNKVPLRMSLSHPRQTAFDRKTRRFQATGVGPDSARSKNFNEGLGYYTVTPQDLYAIYNVNKVFSGSGLNDMGANSTIAVIEQSDFPYGDVDPSTGRTNGGNVMQFRQLFGVPGTLNMTVYHGSGAVTCNDPGIDPANLGEDAEAALDAEWANALAPSARLIFMSCDQDVSQGINTSLMAVVDNNLADVISISYGGSELGFAQSDFDFYDGLYAQAAIQGQSIFVSSGDSGSDVNDQNTSTWAEAGINVSGLSASPLVTSAGGTDFSDAYDDSVGGPPQTSYWSDTTSQYYGDAIHYIPETAWNGSCASSILAASEGFQGADLCAYGFDSVIGSVVAGSGGFSTYYPVPAYQSGVPGYSGSMRAQPDIAGFASDGPWGHALVYCDSNSYYGYCDDFFYPTFGEAGGTSFVAPYMAGVAALLDTYTGSRQGLLNPNLYALAKAQFGTTGSSCFSNGQASNTGVTVGLPDPSCVFHDVTTGNNDVPCLYGDLNCYTPTGLFGMLSVTGADWLTVAYPSTPGYDEATGIGSVDAYNLITKWLTANSAPLVTSAASPSTLSPTGMTTLAATVAAPQADGSVAGPSEVAGVVTFSAGGTVLGSCQLAGNSCSLTTPGANLNSGDNSVVATFHSSATHRESTANPVTVTVVSARNPGSLGSLHAASK